MSAADENPRSRYAVVLLLFLCLRPCLGEAQDFTASGFIDGRLVSPSNQQSWLTGGLGKTRFGQSGAAFPSPQFDEAVLDARFGSRQLQAFLSIRSEPRQRLPVDLLEAYLQYRSESAGSLSWSLRIGAFFPPISLENEGIGWSSPWTLTPSAINSWVGEELRTNGGEAVLHWRDSHVAAELTLALFGWNEPAGVLIADRGWSLSDRPTGLFDRIRLPDVIARARHQPIPLRVDEFKNIDDRVGGYAGLSVREDDLGRVSLLYYDNNADPAARRDGQIAWRTTFTSLGLEGDLGDFVLLGQAMAGETEIAPTPSYDQKTQFQSAYLLLGRYFGDWSAAARIEFFATQTKHDDDEPDLGEHGRAATMALNWRPDRHVRLTAELLEIASYRVQRLSTGAAARQDETQFQLSARFLF